MSGLKRTVLLLRVVWSMNERVAVLQEEDEWETVPTKSKGRKHGADVDGSAPAPPPKELRAAHSLGSDGSGVLLPAAAEEGLVFSGQQQPPQRKARPAAVPAGRGRPLGRDSRRGRGSAAGQLQRMGSIQEGAEGSSPHKPLAEDGRADERRPQPRERGAGPRGPQRRRERRPRTDAPSAGQLQELQQPGAPARALQFQGPSQGAPEGHADQQHAPGRQRDSRPRGGRGFARGRGVRGGRGPGRGQQPMSNSVPADSEGGAGQEASKGPRSFRGRGFGGRGRKLSGPTESSKPHAANVTSVPYVSVQNG